MSELSTRVRVLIIGAAVAGVAAIAARLPDAASWSAKDLVAFLALAFGIAVTEQFQINAGITRVISGRRGVTLMTFNEHQHLAPDLITHR